nr:MAG TPA: hypothetical protein [Caudoviricetes sp.]DAQ60429.1 MAG TPA: hypothetical protein [Bacteriophage sp.]
MSGSLYKPSSFDVFILTRLINDLLTSLILLARLVPR